MSLISLDSSAVLPSGRFACVRGMLAVDWYIACKSPEPSLTFIERLVTVDDQPLTMEEVLAMPIADHFVLLNLINAQIIKAKKTENGVK